jgi:predicted outer membrane lipoprotein
LGGACITVSVAVDPYGFERHASGLPYDAVRAAGLGVVNLLGYALIACAFGVLTVVWLSVRRTAVSRRAWIGFGCFVTFTLVLAVVCPWLALIPGGFEYDRIIFYIYLAVVAFFIGLVIVVTGARTVWAMSRNRDKNRSRMWRVAVHVLIVGALLLACTAVFVVVSFATSDSSFEAFLVVRLVIPGMLSLSLQFALLSAFRFRRLSWLAASLLPEGSQGPASTSLGSSDSALSEQWAANAVSLG